VPVHTGTMPALVNFNTCSQDQAAVEAKANWRVCAFVLLLFVVAATLSAIRKDVAFGFDEVAHAGGKDPYELRRKLLANQPRMLAVLDLAAQKANWGAKLPPGVGRGIAGHFSFDSYVAQVVEASVAKDGAVRVHRVVCAVDCGTVINPDTVKAQMEGGIVFGLTAALKTEITLKNGRVEQSNFHDYQMMRIFESPKIEVYIVPSSVNPTGVGEPGVPPAAPALPLLSSVNHGFGG